MPGTVTWDARSNMLPCSDDPRRVGCRGRPRRPGAARRPAVRPSTPGGRRRAPRRSARRSAKPAPRRPPRPRRGSTPSARSTPAASSIAAARAERWRSPYCSLPAGLAPRSTRAGPTPAPGVRRRSGGGDLVGGGPAGGSPGWHDGRAVEGPESRTSSVSPSWFQSVIRHGGARRPGRRRRRAPGGVPARPAGLRRPGGEGGQGPSGDAAAGTGHDVVPDRPPAGDPRASRRSPPSRGQPTRRGQPVTSAPAPR